MMHECILWYGCAFWGRVSETVPMTKEMMNDLYNALPLYRPLHYTIKLMFST
jgi:hypothetical protein